MIDEVLSICNVSQHDHHWLLDSGESNHMCLYRSWFSTYQSIDDDVVFMGTNVSCKIVGIGSVWVKMYDGTVRTLTYVQFG
jgi:hypothetical protein